MSESILLHGSQLNDPPVVGSRNCNEGARVGDGYVKNGES
jgi:hypothetical protein